MWCRRRVAATLALLALVLGGCAPEGACDEYGTISSLTQLDDARIVLIATVVAGGSSDRTDDGWHPSSVRVLEQPWQYSDVMPSHVDETVTVLVQSPAKLEDGRTYAFYAHPDAEEPFDLFHARLVIDVETDSPLNESPQIAREFERATAAAGGSLVEAATAITAEQASDGTGRLGWKPGTVSNEAFAEPQPTGCP